MSPRVLHNPAIWRLPPCVPSGGGGTALLRAPPDPQVRRARWASAPRWPDAPASPSAPAPGEQPNDGPGQEVRCLRRSLHPVDPYDPRGHHVPAAAQHRRAGRPIPDGGHHRRRAHHLRGHRAQRLLDRHGQEGQGRRHVLYHLPQPGPARGRHARPRALRRPLLQCQPVSGGLLGELPRLLGAARGRQYHPNRRHARADGRHDRHPHQHGARAQDAVLHHGGDRGFAAFDLPRPSRIRARGPAAPAHRRRRSVHRPVRHLLPGGDGLRGGGLDVGRPEGRRSARFRRARSRPS